jgi:hypothetical protein
MYSNIANNANVFEHLTDFIVLSPEFKHKEFGVALFVIKSNNLF